MFNVFNQKKKRELDVLIMKVDKSLVKFTNKEIFNRKSIAERKSELAMLRIEKKKDPMCNKLDDTIVSLEIEQRALVLNISRLKSHKESILKLRDNYTKKLFTYYDEQVNVVIDSATTVVDRLDSLYTNLNRKVDLVDR